MALAETLLRKLHKLGLLPKIIKGLPSISLALAALSIVWMLILPMDGQYRHTYISENALMPAQVTSYFRESEWNIVRGYRLEVVKMDFSDVDQNSRTVAAWLLDVGLKPLYHDNSTLYTILHAPRGDDTEAMVLTVPWITSDGESNVGGVALGVALARYFNRMSIWSKNIIVVFPRDGHAALRAWVEAYHTSLDETAGLIEAAIVLEYASAADHFDYYAIDYEGLNGQLPNLDLINTANTIGFHENLKCSVQNTAQHMLSKNTYGTRLATLASGVVRLALAGLAPSSPGCDQFSGWQIQAITIRALGSSGPADITQMGRIVDLTLRSVNNLLEKFHQSFFFYLLLSSQHFVSIGTYLPAAVLMAVSFAVSALLSLLLNSSVSISSHVSSIGTLLALFSAIELVCLLLAFALPAVVRLGVLPEAETVKIIYCSLAVVCAGFCVSSYPKTLSKQLTSSLIAFSLFVTALLTTALLIVHFSLALSVSLCSLPLTFVHPLQNQLQTHPQPKTKAKIVLSLLVSNPAFIIAVVGSSYFGGIEGIWQLTRGLLTSWSELQCWTWFVVILGWLSAWFGVAIACVLGDFSNEQLQEKKNV